MSRAMLGARPARNAIALALAFLSLQQAEGAQQDASSRLRSITSAPRQVSYDVATGVIRSQKGPAVFFGPDVIYNNTCDTGAYAGMSPGERFTDNGQLPGFLNGQLPGCGGIGGAYTINGWTISYCADRATIDLAQRFHSLHDNCTAQSSLVPAASFSATGLPGNGTGGVLCWIITFDLTGSSAEFSLAADGDGVWDGGATFDTFGTSYELTNITGTASGIVLAGNPVFLAMGCDFAVNTVFEVGDPTGSSPQGTGYGSTDSFGLEDMTGYLGCFFFGGWPANPWSSYYLQVHTSNAQCQDNDPTDPVCIPDGVGVLADCPCVINGMPNDPETDDEGCKNSTGVGGKLEGGAGSGTSISAADFTLFCSQLPTDMNFTIYAGTALATQGSALYTGVACMQGTTNRSVVFNSGPTGAITTPTGPLSITSQTNEAVPGYYVPGTYFMQLFYRDLDGLDCENAPLPPNENATLANFSAGVQVTLTP